MSIPRGVGRSVNEKSGQMEISRLLLAISLVNLCVVGNVLGATPAEEAQALESVLKTLQYPSYSAATPPCTFFKPEVVKCDPASGLITELNLSSMGLQGKLPPQIGTFKSLELLDLTTYNLSLGYPNKIVGPLPDELGNLAQLKYFNFSFNIINSDFPPCLLRLTNLIDLRIDNCAITGQLPKEINRLKKLEHLFLGNNNMTGPFPKTLGDLTSLRELTVWQNEFRDQIPESLGKLENLTYMNFHTCSMWGPLPESFGNLKKMQKLWLYRNDLTGRVPDTWRGLQSAVDLNIRQNSLSGTVPGFLPLLPNLKILDISQNKFDGPIPPTLNVSPNLLSSWNKLAKQNCDMSCNYFNGSFPETIPSNVNVTGNCFTNSTKESDSCKRDLRCDQLGRKYNANGCAPCPSQQIMYDFIKCLCAPLDVKFGEEKKSFPIGAIVGAVVCFVALLLAIFALWRYKPSVFRDPFKQKDIDYGPWDIPKGVQKYSLAELAKATNNWNESNEIGQGGFGKVFHGIFEDGKLVAIKRASDSSTQGAIEFRNEVLLLSRLHHRHLVRLEGFCDDRGLQILVYEFMENGNLHDLLAGVKKGKDLSWFKRLEIAVGVAQGLDYLHTFADPPVIHRDIKPSNILLDSELVAKVADFGISKEKIEIDTHISTRPAGTAGYLDPEYFLRRHLTTASDVYAYGVCLLELITGQESIDHMRLEEFNLIEWVKPRFKTGGVDAIVDTALGEDYDKDVMKEMTEVALACSAFSKNDRITMKEVLNILEPRLAKASALDAGSISEKVKKLSMKDDSNIKLYNKKGSTSDLEVPLPDHTSTSSSATTTQFDIQILSPR